MEPTERDKFLEMIQVSYGTRTQLDRFAELLIDWNSRINLVAESTLPHIWTRHFLDSAQLFNLVPKNILGLADMGSGAGFPGIILSILGVQNIHLIESTGKKAEFLKVVVDELGLKAEVHNCRVESMKGLKVDVVTARACAPLKELFRLANFLIEKDSFCILLKGKNVESELTESSKMWTFESEIIPSLSDDSGRVLIVKKLKHRNAALHKRRR